MTEASRPQPTAELAAWLDGWEKCTQAVLSQTTGQAVMFEAVAEDLARTESDAWFTVVAGGAVRGEMTLRLPASTAVLLAQKFLQETEAAPEQPTAEHKEALEELLRQVAGQAATTLAATAGGEVQLHVSSGSAPSWAEAGKKRLRTRDESGREIEIEIVVSAALAAALPAPKAAAPEIPKATAAPVGVQPEPVTAEASIAEAHYERLRDVLLEVKLRFGTRRMLLRDVLALSAGVVVELDNHVNSPVDLLLDGKVVAHGDVVVVDGKYGLRVTQVVDVAPAS